MLFATSEQFAARRVVRDLIDAKLDEVGGTPARIEVSQDVYDAMRMGTRGTMPEFRGIPFIARNLPENTVQIVLG